ncbi:MAG TPA: hypothetical protein DEB24_01535 [Coriobacteriia bacterium]|nr:hypothetical protein [Coriobacteriia bacterium]
MKRAVRWIFLTLLIVELILLFSGLIPTHIAALLIIVTETTALIFGLSVIIPTVFGVIRRVRSEGISVSFALQQEFKEIVPKPLLFAFRAELGSWSAIGRGITRRKDVPEDAVVITYGSQFKTMAIFLLCLTPLEIGAVELVFFFFHLPVALHVILIILTVYGLFFFLGMIFSTVVYPHHIGPDTLTLRYMSWHTICLDVDSIESVTVRNRECVTNKTIEVDENVEGGLLALNDWRETNVSLRFKEGYHPMVNGELSERTFKVLAFRSDEPSKAVSAIQNRIMPPEGV